MPAWNPVCTFFVLFILYVMNLFLGHMLSKNWETLIIKKPGTSLTSNANCVKYRSI